MQDNKNKDMPSIDDLPITKHVSQEGPRDPEDKSTYYEAVGNSVVRRWWSDYEGGGFVATEIAKCRPGDWAEKLAMAMNLLRKVLRWNESETEAWLNGKQNGGGLPPLYTKEARECLGEEYK